MFEFLIKKSYKISNWLWLLLGIIILTICILYITLHKKPSYTNSNGNGATSTTNDKIKSGNETSGTTTTANTVLTTTPTITTTVTSTVPNTSPTTAPITTAPITTVPTTASTTTVPTTVPITTVPTTTTAPTTTVPTTARTTTVPTTAPITTVPTTVPTTTPTPCSDIKSYCNSLDGTKPITCNWITSEASTWDLPINHNLNCQARCFCAMYNGSINDIAGGKINASNLICGSDYTGYSDAGCSLQPVTTPNPTTTPSTASCSDITSYCNSLGGTKPTTCNWITGSSWDFPINHKLDCPARCFCAMYNGSTDNITGKKLDLSNTICQTHYDGYSEAGCSLQPVTTPKPTTTPSTASCTDIASYCNSLDGTNPTTCNWFVARENSQWDNPKNHNLNCPARCFCAIYNASRDDIAGGKIYASNTSCQTNYTGYSAAGCT